MKEVVFFAFLLTTFSLDAQEQNDGQSNVIQGAGDMGQYLIPFTALSVMFLKHDDAWQDFMKTFAISMGTAYVLKYAVNRGRPDGGSYSMPSGHTASAFAGASFLHKRYGLWPYGILSYAGASFVGFSRIQSEQHYVSDVLAGIVIGVVPNLLFIERFEHVEVVPMVGRDRRGLMVRISF